ncbi:glycoside hydrolase domain-containing protein [Streptomyces boncukensis]|uniref:glycoside hydrolase domain-containing protein n=1 Tax=Streptomyces boncukensis TaxID=2711219 RepID=UPI0030B9E6EF
MLFLVALFSLLAGAVPPVAAETSTRARAAAADPPSLIRGDPRRFGARIFTGRAFDTCQAPPYATMRAWKRSSPYGAAGVYIGGRGRGCPNQRYLTPSWVRDVHRLGWRLLPLYVGSQAPCVIASHKRKFAMSHSSPYQRGVREGQDAVRQARRLGMAPRSAVYLDMEAYRLSDRRCADTTLRFVQGWNTAVRKERYIPGFYSSADSGIAHLERARAAGARRLPTALWFARWGVRASTQDEPRLHPRAWQPHRRAHQFAGNVKRTYGSRTLTIDRNVVDAPVAVLG